VLFLPQDVARAALPDADEVDVPDSHGGIYKRQLLLNERDVVLRDPALEHAHHGPARARVGAREEVQQVLSHHS
jgi:hypothetical protein